MRMAGVWCVLFGVVAAPSQSTPPDFGGVWQLDRSESVVAPTTAMMWVRISQSADAVQMNLRTFTTGKTEENQTFMYAVGTAPSANRMHGAPMTSHAAWHGSALEVHSEVAFGASVLTMDDRWTLSADGGTLTCVEHSQFAADPARESTAIYVRRAAADWPADTSSEPAEKVFRNIQILAGRPSSQVPLIMDEFSRAIGGACTTCHVVGAWDVDEKPQKAIAREMWRLTTGLGGGLLADRGGLTCWTCHRGQPKPARFPSAELAADIAKWPSTAPVVPDATKLTMTVYARSLGVTCEYCHDPDDWKARGKAPMRAVTTMLALFDEMPRLSPVAANRSQCWMCHQGHVSPERRPMK